ncbi:uracil-dna glycosylase [Stemphylium lycopersici]|nr:uracil-dna glycosylase [Stemphylium lycopersici]
MSLKRKTAAAVTDASKKPKQNGSITAFFGAPKADPAKPKQTAAAAKFDRDAWVANLTDEQKELLKLELDTLHESWLPHLKDVLVTPQFLELKRFLKKELAGPKPIYPPMEDVYSWSRHTPLPNVKVVITGQDPYHNPNQAHGLCFSIRPPAPAPPSLQNIYKALKKEYPDYKAPPNRGGLLTPWADRGVLLINTCLTVRKNEPNSHSNRGWEMLMQKVIDTVAKVRTNGVVFLAWGSPAQKRMAGIPTDRHLVLKSVHPSPLSASRGFFDCGHFRKCNEWLEQRYGKDGGIDWDLNVDAKVERSNVKVEDAKPVDTKAVDTKIGGTEVKAKEAKAIPEDDEDDDEFDEAMAQAEEAMAEVEAEERKNEAKVQDVETEANAEEKETKAKVEETAEQKEL